MTSFMKSMIIAMNMWMATITQIKSTMKETFIDEC